MHGLLDGVGDVVRRFVDVSQTVGFVDDHQIPRDLANVGLLASGKLIRAKTQSRSGKWIEVAGADGLVEGPRLHDRGRQKKLVGKFLAPLFAQVGGQDHEKFAPSLSPLLSKQEAGFDRLPQPDFVGQGLRRAKTDSGTRTAPPRSGGGLGPPEHPARTPASFSTLSDGLRLVSSCAKNFA